MKRVTEKAVGAELIKSVRPEQQIVKIVHDEMIEMMGPSDPSIRFEKTGPTVSCCAACRARARRPPAASWRGCWQQQGRKPMLVAADLQRPAADRAVEGDRAAVERAGLQRGGLEPGQGLPERPVEANRPGRDTVILDTAGRLHIDDELMAELIQIEKKVQPHQVYFVCDAMTGPGRRLLGRGVQRGPRARRRDHDQARRRRPRRRRALGPKGHRRSGQVRRQGREARQARAVRPRAAGRPDAGHGRHRWPGRGGAGRPSTRKRPKRSRRGWPRGSSTWTTSASRSSR